jgi:glycosyltransferase involved in cell wall biosynthesis
MPESLATRAGAGTAKRFRGVVRRVLASRKRALRYVVGGVRWSEYWDGRYLTESLRERHGLPAYLARDAHGFRGQVLHFGNRHAYLDGTFRSVHPSNTVFLTWFHSFPPGLEHEGRDLNEALLEAQPRITRLVVPCRASHDSLVGLGVPPEKIALVPIGVDLARFTPAGDERERRTERDRLGVPREALCVASFQKDGVGWGAGDEPKLIKGPDTFLAAIERLAALRDDVFVLLTGPARGYVKRGLERMRVPYAHHQLDSYWDLAPCYRAADIYLIASRSEGGPKGLVESWASGVPVVSTRMGMSADLVEHGRNGLLAAVDDADELAHSVDLLARDPALRKRCSESALRDVASLDWPVIAERYLRELYADAFAEKPGMEAHR